MNETFIKLADDRMKEFPLSENQKRAIKELAASKYDIDSRDHDSRDMEEAAGFCHGYSLCLMENSVEANQNVQELIRCGQAIYKHVAGSRVITNDDVLFNRLGMAIVPFEPKVLTFDYDLEKILTNTIEFCRGLEKEKAGEGFKALIDLAPATKIYDAVTLCLKDMSAKYEFSEFKNNAHCKTKGCFNHKLEGGELCKKCQKDHNGVSNIRQTRESQSSES